MLGVATRASGTLDEVEVELSFELGLEVIFELLDFLVPRAEVVAAPAKAELILVLTGEIPSVAYEVAFHSLFDSLDWVEGLLTQQRYLVGDELTEADWRLFTTLIRFDAVYFGHFKTNRQLIADYPAISAYVRELYQVQAVAETVSFDHIKTHYYASHLTINPTGIVPLGPQQDFTAPHNRDAVSAA